MRQLLLNIPDNKFKSFLEFLKQFPFVKVAEKSKTTSPEKRTFTVMNIEKKDFKFNRNELNER